MTKESNAAIDYTTYDIKKGLLKLSGPAMLSSIFTAAYDIFDMIWVGKLGTNAIAGVTVAMSLYWFGAMFNDLFGTPSVILLSRRYGEKDYDGMQKIFSQAILMKLTFAISFLILAFSFRWPLLRLLGSKGEALQEAVNFFSARIWFMPFAFASFTINTAFRSTGDVKRFAVLQIIASVFNIVFDPVLIFWAKMGVAGAAVTTGISEMIVLGTGLYWLSTGRSRVKLSLFRGLKPDWKIIRTMFRLGLPTIIDSASHHAMNLLLIRILNMYGVVVVAAWGIIGRTRTVLFMIAFSLEMAISTLVGQNLGAGFKARAKEATLAGIRLNMSLVSIYGLIMVIFAPWVVGVFDSNPEVIILGALFIRIMSVGDVFFAGYMSAAGGIVGAGGTATNMVISIIGNWVILIPVMFFFANVLHAPATVLPWAFVLNTFAMFAMSYGVIRNDRWLERSL